MAHDPLKKSTRNNTLVFYCINVTGALASVPSVRLRLVPFWTTLVLQKKNFFQERRWFFWKVLRGPQTIVSRTPKEPRTPVWEPLV